MQHVTAQRKLKSCASEEGEGIRRVNLSSRPPLLGLQS